MTGSDQHRITARIVIVSIAILRGATYDHLELCEGTAAVLGAARKVADGVRQTSVGNDPNGLMMSGVVSRKH